MSWLKNVAGKEKAIISMLHFFTGVYASDFGLWNTNCGEVVRHQHEIGAENVKLLFNIVPEAAKYLADRDLKQIAKSTVFNCVDRASQLLNPADAPHGDYGMIRSGDIVIIISKGGKTTEMVNLIPVAKARGAKIITVTENPDSPIMQESDLNLILSTGLEACPYQCLSTTSVTAVFALFDAISIGCMLYNGIDKNYFRLVHPAGGVGAMLAEEG